MTTFLNLPYEIFCKIVADLLGDINTLVNLALVSKSWNEEATKPLYSSSPHIPGRVTTSRRHLRAIRFLQVINTSQRHANMVRHFEWTIGESSGQKKFLEFFLKAVGRMKNLTSLYIRESSSKGSMKDVIPHLIHPDSKPSYQLKKLKWSCTRLPASIYQLCNFIAFHRHTLEDISLDFHDGHLPAFETHEDRRQLIGQFKAFREQDVYPPQTSFPDLPPSRVLWPLARLHTLRGSQEALDTVLEVAAEPEQIQRLDIIASSESEFLQPSHGSPNFDDILCRLVAYLKLNPLKIFNVDLVRNSTLKLENIIPHLSSIEKMTINIPSSLVGSATVPIYLISISSIC
ncbi:hypothetical protein BJ165DRAFT_933203 [Panaeolus papilionaceus]|nr:hypothetical protein BJ165DRAFT_933203 [Panaeolus papilionaceus]